MATKKQSKTEWPFTAGDTPRAKKLTKKEVEALGASDTSEEAEVLATGWKEKVVLGKLEEQGLQERSSGESVVETEAEEADIASWDTLTFKASKVRGLRVRGRLVGTEDLTLGP